MPRLDEHNMKETTIPRLGYVLRAVITAAGLRNRIDALGLGKDLDDLAIEARPGATFRLIQEIEDVCAKALEDDSGRHWEQIFRLAWGHVRETMQRLVQSVAMDPIPMEEGRSLHERLITIPMLSGLLAGCRAEVRGPDLDLWWESPFRAWVSFAASVTHVPAKDVETNLANHLDVDPRTLERWIGGDPIGKICWPFRPTIAEALGKAVLEKLGEHEVDRLAGWLMVAVAFQSLPAQRRDAVRREFSLRSQMPRSLDDAVETINRRAVACGAGPLRAAALPILEEIETLFEAPRRDLEKIHEYLVAFRRDVIQQEQSDGQRQGYQYIHDWFAARLAAFEGRSEEALALYRGAVEGVWWTGDGNQQPILNEALLYAVGAGDKVAAEHYWDKTFLLGLNAGPKRPLDEQELRRISFGFERVFHPQKAKHRIPPRIEVDQRLQEFQIDRKALANPNRKEKFAGGRTRRTPFMVTIRDGTLEDVQRMHAAGGDPDDYIPESGESPLSYAMRRACDRKDPIIMEYLLSLDLRPDTVNRPASTKRETPLKIAIEMANAGAVSRLIALGADVEHACDQVPSALCYAMLLLHASLHRSDPTQEIAFLRGKGRGDVYDAKDGAVLDVDLAARRQALMAITYASPWHRQMFEAVKDYYIGPAEDRRQVIKALLEGGANANRRYKVEPHHIDEWTPTLFAAEVGDLEVFRMLVEHPGHNRGDPDLVLRAGPDLERFDALWVAIAYGRHAIVSYLTDGRQAPTTATRAGDF